MHSIGRKKRFSYRATISSWNVYLPFDLPREDYIRNCYATNTVTLVNDNGDFKNNVPVGILNMQLIKFPKDLSSLGSEVICVTMPYSQNMKVIDVFYNNNDGTSQTEGQYRLYKDGKGVAEVSIRRDGIIDLSTMGDDEVSKINIHAASKGQKAQINIVCNGDVNIVAQGGNINIVSDKDVNMSCLGGKTTVLSDTELLLQYKKGDKVTQMSVTDGDITMTSEKVYLNKDKAQPILLGNDTIDFIGELIDQLGNENAGPYILLGRPKYKLMKQKLEKLKSKINFAS